MSEARSGEVREAYDTVAASYAAQIPGLSAETSLDVAMIDSFAARVRDSGGGPVLDAGCGPGRVSGYLAGQGLEISGIDLSPAMVNLASTGYPNLRFEVGTLQHLPVADGELSGIVAWYSIIHTEPAGLPEVFAEFRRALRPGGHLVLGIHVGTGIVRVTRSYGHDVGVDLQLFLPEDVAGLLEAAGFSVLASMSRAAEGSERRPQAALLARLGDDPRPA